MLGIERARERRRICTIFEESENETENHAVVFYVVSCFWMHSNPTSPISVFLCSREIGVLQGRPRVLRVRDRVLVLRSTPTVAWGWSIIGQASLQTMLIT
jgi:hypothetical protein